MRASACVRVCVCVRAFVRACVYPLLSECRLATNACVTKLPGNSAEPEVTGSVWAGRPCCLLSADRQPDRERERERQRQRHREIKQR